MLSYSAVRVVFIFLQVALFFSLTLNKRVNNVLYILQFYNLKVHIKTQNG